MTKNPDAVLGTVPTTGLSGANDYADFRLE